MKHHATVQTVRERYNIRREKNPKEIVKDFFTTVDVPITRVLNSGVMLRILIQKGKSKKIGLFNQFFKFYRSK